MHPLSGSKGRAGQGSPGTDVTQLVLDLEKRCRMPLGTTLLSPTGEKQHRLAGHRMHSCLRRLESVQKLPLTPVQPVAQARKGECLLAEAFRLTRSNGTDLIQMLRLQGQCGIPKSRSERFQPGPQVKQHPARRPLHIRLGKRRRRDDFIAQQGFQLVFQLGLAYGGQPGSRQGEDRVAAFGDEIGQRRERRRSRPVRCPHRGSHAACQFRKAERRRCEAFVLIRVFVHTSRPFPCQINRLQVQLRDIVQKRLQHGFHRLVADLGLPQQLIRIRKQQAIDAFVPLIGGQQLTPPLGPLEVQQARQGAANARLGQQHIRQIAGRHQRRQDRPCQGPRPHRPLQPGAALRGCA